MNRPNSNAPEIWGGIECTINRVQDKFLDQLELAGFYDQPCYLDAITELGIKQIRFPILWEKHQVSAVGAIDFSWAESCLKKIRSKNIVPVAGLLHHGSGPAFTNLLAEDFPALFAKYAHAVANHFPWIEYYTPVNEPLTTARFSGLYGLWYPHKKNDVAFIKILLNELKATVLAMKEIRKINPSAKLIQTEDLGKTYSTPLLSYQSSFENERRWLTYDILCGRFNSSHPLWNHFIRLGVEKSMLDFFIANPCSPDIIGVNHYLTSERYIDEDISHYPIELVGGNGLHHYADIEAVRIEIVEPHGLKHLLEEIWQRYKIPLAITEAHLNCSRDEQVRWFHHVYETALKVKKEGIDIRAVTSWSLLGSFGWNKLLTCTSCDYETGAFDISAGYARPTAVASLIKNLAESIAADKNIIGQLGWWKLKSRYYKQHRKSDEIKNLHPVQPIIIIGNRDGLGTAFSKICTERNIHHFLLSEKEEDICDEIHIASMIDHYHPWAIIDCIKWDAIEQDETGKISFKENLVAANKISLVCKRHKIKLIAFSFDDVFDGKTTLPYTEVDSSNVLKATGKSKQLPENIILSNHPDALIIRTGPLFGEDCKDNFVYQLLSHKAEGNQFIASDDTIVSPTYLPHLVKATLDLLIDNAEGIWHLVNKDAVSWFQFAQKIMKHAACNQQEFLVAVDDITIQPGFYALASSKYNLMPSLDEALDNYFFSTTLLSDILLNQNQTNETV